MNGNSKPGRGHHANLIQFEIPIDSLPKCKTAALTSGATRGKIPEETLEHRHIRTERSVEYTGRSLHNREAEEL